MSFRPIHPSACAILLYLRLGSLVWLVFLESGIHATIYAGRVVAFTIPARYEINEFVLLAKGRQFMNVCQQSIIFEFSEACEQVRARLQKLEDQLHLQPVPVSVHF